MELLSPHFALLYGESFAFHVAHLLTTSSSVHICCHSYLTEFHHFGFHPYALLDNLSWSTNYNAFVLNLPSGYNLTDNRDCFRRCWNRKVNSLRP